MQACPLSFTGFPLWALSSTKNSHHISPKWKCAEYKLARCFGHILYSWGCRRRMGGPNARCRHQHFRISHFPLPAPKQITSPTTFQTATDEENGMEREWYLTHQVTKAIAEKWGGSVHNPSIMHGWVLGDRVQEHVLAIIRRSRKKKVGIQKVGNSEPISYTLFRII